MINLDSVLKSRDITLTIIKVMVFPVVTYGCESWTVKKAECQRIGIFKLWCWRGLLKGSWTGRRSNQSIFREITLNIHRNDWCWSQSSSFLVIWCKRMTHWKGPWCWERLRAGGEEGIRGSDDWISMNMMQWTWTCANSGRWWGTGRPDMLQSMGLRRVGHEWVTEQQHRRGNPSGAVCVYVCM